MATTKVQSELIVDDVALAGNPTTTTQSAGNNTTRIATTAFVTAAIDNLVDSAPGTMNTLNEIAAALNDDANFNTTVTNAIAAKLPLAGGTMSGNLVIADDSANTEKSVLIRNTTVTSMVGVEGSSANRFVGSAANNMFLGTTTADGIELATNNNVRAVIDSSGVATFKKKVVVSAADGVTANDYVMSVQNLEATDGQSFGLSINAGSTSADIPLNVTDHDGSNALLRVYGNGSTALVGSLSLTNTSHSVATIQAGTNSSASLRLKNDNIDWDVNCQTNDSFALYQHSYAGSSTGLQPITVLPNGNVGINKSVPDEKLTVNVATASASKDSLSVQNTGVSSTGHAVGMRFQYNTAVPSAIRTHLTDTSSGAGHLSLLTSSNGAANNLISRLKVHPAGHVSINSTQTGTEKTGGLVLVGPIVTQGRFGNGQIGRNQSNGADFSSVSANWATHASSGVTGSYSGSVKFTVPSAAGSAGQGYGSFCGIIQVSGYNGPAMTASFHGYQNQALYGATSSILSNNGSFSITLGINGSHGWYIEVDVPGITHPNAYIQLSHGGTSNSASIWDLNECVWTWS